MEKMLVTQGLNELKTLQARISRAINNTSFVVSAKTCEEKVNPSKTKKDFCDEAKAAMDSIQALIARREAIKAAIIESNAKTMIDICNTHMSVAKVIDMKDSIEFRADLLAAIKSQLRSAVSDMNRKNANMEDKIDDLVRTAFNKESKTKIAPEDYDSIAVPYRKSNEYSLVDPIKCEEWIAKEEAFIEEFKSTVDQKLQISNCVTYIEF